ncbi:hypothetical protein Acsp04_14480 [Actinomadura sp. NBRC 104425]|uniref:hypothetical protein n=1 Tax=Actinomadura sp. NBRC 104425 TaxID=3032204 RepID=UPI0024A03D75|nr:hypothetical protein [Actinomadura sp. NBRC 104425]GLZ11213.1 hypothetical protein Acsp04_14480 [Actinomadura sp. NBRC 104425]
MKDDAPPERNPYPLPGQDWADQSAPQPQRAAGRRPGGWWPRNTTSRDRAKFKDVVLSWRVVAGVWVVALVMLVGRHVLGIGDDDAYVAPPPSWEPPSPSAEPVSTVPVKVTGWKAVTSDKYGFTYDVPKSWRINSPTLLIGFEDKDGKPLAAMSATAEYRDGFCASERVSSRAATGFNQYIDGTVPQVAEHAARKWAKAAYTPDNGPEPNVSLSTPRTVSVGRHKGVHVVADVTAISQAAPCQPPRALVHIVAVPGREKGKTVAFVLYADQGVADAAPKRTLEKIAGSLRPS